MRMGRILAVGFVSLIAILFLANQFMAWRVASQLRRQVAAIRAGGDPASLAELAPQRIEDTENAAVVLQELAPRLDQFAKTQVQFFHTPQGEEYESRTSRGLAAAPEQLAAIRKILNNYPDIAAGLAAAAACDWYGSVADFSLGPQEFVKGSIDRINQVRGRSRFIGWQMETLVAEGKQEEAAKLGIESLRLARLYENEPLMINALVSIAMRGIAVDSLYDALAAGPISAKTHAALDRELALQDDPQRLVRILKTERAYSASMVDEFGSGPPNSSGAQLILGRMFGWTVQRHFVGVFDSFDEQLKLAAKPWTAVHAQNGRTGVPNGSKFGVMADALVPATNSLFSAEARDIASLRALRIFNAARQFREEKGHEAIGLVDLPVPQGATIDPFSDQLLKMKLMKEGWIVYSVMENGVDDGGVFMERKDFGVAPRRLRVRTKPE